MPKKEINVELEQLPTSVSKEFIQSLESKLGFSKTQTYFPVMNKYTEFDNNEKEKREFILSSKYQCTKINDLVSFSYRMVFSFGWHSKLTSLFL